MHEQTDFSTLSAKKLKKGDIHQKNAVKGERNGLFQKWPKGASTFGKGLVTQARSAEKSAMCLRLVGVGGFC